MARLLIGIIVIYTAIALYSLFDCIAYDRSNVKMMPKFAWAAVILLLPAVGIVLWFIFGRGGVGQKPLQQAAPPAPDNDPEYLKKISDDIELRRLRELQRQQEELRRIEKLRGDGPEPRTYSNDGNGGSGSSDDAGQAGGPGDGAGSGEADAEDPKDS